ncbi:hypothetical protein [Lacrimispora sp.]|uniref:hypothetical protein n=1 Tax=Lacrimispora sp. TaxID=2719234 RepID=UPI0028A0CC2C|nr:hypothetical protein [Lacrimispora sp.]
MIRKYTERPDIDILYDGTFRFSSRYMMEDALKNRVTRFCDTFSPFFDFSYGKCIAKKAAQFYEEELRKNSISVQRRDLRDSMENLIFRYYIDIYSSHAKHDDIIKRAIIQKNSDGLYRYELPIPVLLSYIESFYKKVDAFYEEAYNFIKKEYIRK